MLVSRYLLLSRSRNLVNNGSFDNEFTAWTATGSATDTVVAGRARMEITGAPSSSGGKWQDVSVIAGLRYRITADVEVESVTSGRAVVAVYDGSAFTTELSNASNTSAGVYQIDMSVTPSTSILRIYFLVAGDSSTTTVAFFDNFACRKR